MNDQPAHFHSGRRDFLRNILRGAAGAGLAMAMKEILSPNLATAATASTKPTELLGGKTVKTGQFVFPRLRFSVTDETYDLWNISPIGDANLRYKLAQQTNINVSQEPRVVNLND